MTPGQIRRLEMLRDGLKNAGIERSAISRIVAKATKKFNDPVSLYELNRYFGHNNLPTIDKSTWDEL